MLENHTKQEVSVSAGEVNACKENGTLRASAIGSCVVVVLYEPGSCVGGMAHVMLPGASCDKGPYRKTRYAKDALDGMMRQMAALGAEESGVRVCLVGGANVLGDGRHSPGAETVESLNEIFDRTGLPIVATEVGGTQRRSCALDVGRGRVTYTVGDSEQRVLWEAAGPVSLSTAAASSLWAKKKPDRKMQA